MNETSSELMAKAFERAREHWRSPAKESLELPPARPPERPPRPCTIAISRESGAGGGELAREIGARLGWHVYDRELVDLIANEAGIRAELLESIDEKRSHWLVECLEAFAGVRVIAGEAYARQLAETLLAVSVHGHAVIVGRGSTMILPPETTLRVRFVAPLEDRIERVSRRLALSATQSKRRVRQVDRDRAQFVKQYFQESVGDEHLYDLVLNTARFTKEQAAEIVVAALRCRESQSP